MKKGSFFKRHWIAILVVALVVWAILYVRKPRIDKSPKTLFFYDTEATVATWSLENVLTLQGTTQFADSQKLTFMTQGKVTSVNVKVWDEVKKDQVLAKISTDDLDNSVAQARLDIENQQNTLQDLLDARNLDLEYLQQKANYDALMLQQETIDQDQELAMETLQQQIRDAQKTYNDAKADYEELLSWSDSANADLALSSTIRRRNQTYENSVLELKTIINSITNVLDAYDKKLIVTDKYKHEVARNNYIWADDISLKNKSNNLYQQISDDLNTLTEIYNELNSKDVKDLTKEEIVNAYYIVRTIWSELVDWGEVSYNMFKASITSSSYTLTNIDADANTALSNQNLWMQYIQKYTSTVDSLANLDDDTSLEDTKLKMDKAKTNLDKLLLQVDSLKTTQEKERASLEDQIDTAKRNLNKIEWWESLNETQISTAQNRLKQLQRNLQNTLDKYEDYELTANFDWVITQMDLQIWDNIKSSNNSSEKYIYVESNNILEMTFSVEQVDIIQLKVWMEAEVYLDAYDDQVYHGYISEINTIPNTSSMTTTYPMTITFEKNDPNETILAGMWGSAKIILNRTDDVLIVPSQAITTISGNQVVMLKQWENWIDQIVETWESDESNTEIINWLKAWDTIKALYISNEWMINAWLELGTTDLDKMKQQMQQGGWHPNMWWMMGGNNRWWGMWWMGGMR